MSAGVAKSRRRAWPGARSGQSPPNSSTATAAVGNLSPGGRGAPCCGRSFGQVSGQFLDGRVVPDQQRGPARAGQFPYQVEQGQRAGRVRPRLERHRRGPAEFRRHQLPGLPGPARDRADHGVRQVAVAAQPAPDDRGVAPPALGQRPLLVRHVRPVRLGVPQQDQPPRRVSCHRAGLRWRRTDEHEVDRGGPHHRPAVLIDRLDQSLDDAAVRLAQRSARLDDRSPDTERIARSHRIRPADLVEASAAEARFRGQVVARRATASPERPYASRSRSARRKARRRRPPDRREMAADRTLWRKL